MKVIALDPGITTGYAVGVIELDAVEPMGVISGQFKWDESGLFQELNRSSPDRIIYETFQYRSEKMYGKKGALYKVELFPRNLIGVINLYAQLNTNVKLYTQSPAAGKSYWGDQMLKKALVYKVGSPHANDAMRHLLQWYQFGPGYQFNKEGFTYLS